jgi:hypothetical protein
LIPRTIGRGYTIDARFFLHPSAAPGLAIAASESARKSAEKAVADVSGLELDADRCIAVERERPREVDLQERPSSTWLLPTHRGSDPGTVIGSFPLQSAHFAVGSDPAEQDGYFHAAIDEVAVYGRALTAEDVARHFTVGQASSSSHFGLDQSTCSTFGAGGFDGGEALVGGPSCATHHAVRKRRSAPAKRKSILDVGSGSIRSRSVRAARFTASSSDEEASFGARSRTVA